MLGEFLIMRNILTEEQLKEALVRQKSLGKMLGETIVHLGFIDKEMLDELLQEHLVHRADDILSDFSD